MQTRVRSIAAVATAWLLAVAVHAGPEQVPAELPLRIRQTVPVTGVMAGGFLHPIKCDAEGNLYMRGSHPLGIYLAGPVKKISPDRKLAATFRLEDAPGFEANATFDDFAFDPHGKLYLLAYRRTEKGGGDEVEQVIVAFDSEGNYDSTVKLEVLHHPGQLTVFASGEMLASGIKIEEVDGKLRAGGETFTGIFDRRGKLIKELTLEGDIQAEDPKVEPVEKTPAQDVSVTGGADSRSGEAPRKLESKDFKRAISNGVAVPADDGNIYLMRATGEPLVYVIAPSGTVLRRMTIARPSEYSRPASALQVAAGRLVVPFIETDPSGKFRRHLFVVANAETGEIQAHYLSPPKVGGALACYTPNGFTFFGFDEARRLVVHTTYPP